MRSLRFDTFRLDTVERTPTGGLKISATPTRAGVFTYRRADGKTVRELRHPDEVFHPESLSTLAGAALTDLHPPSGAVTPATWKDASVGHVGETVTHDGKLVHATVYVNDADAIQKIQSGERKELSAGYYADTDETPGTYDGQRYDRIQRNIQYNHLSLQPPGGGRAGPECALRIDSDDAILVDTGQAVPETAIMLKLDGKEATQEAIDALTAERDKTKGALAAATAKVADLQKRCDSAEDPKRIATAVKERVALLETIRKGNAFFLDADEEPAAEADGAADPIALMTEALTKWQPGIDIKGKSPEFIMGAFAAMMADVTQDEGAEPTTQAQDALAKPAGNTAPEMELNGTSAARRDGRVSRSVQARRGLHADRGGVRQDDRGFPVTGRQDARPLTAEERQRKDYQERSTLPMAASRKDD